MQRTLALQIILLEMQAVKAMYSVLAIKYNLTKLYSSAKLETFL